MYQLKLWRVWKDEKSVCVYFSEWREREKREKNSLEDKDVREEWRGRNRVGRKDEEKGEVERGGERNRMGREEEEEREREEKREGGEEREKVRMLVCVTSLSVFSL